MADRVALINKGEIIAEGSPSEIKAQTAGKRIRCITSLTIDTLRQIPGVTEVKEDREAFEIEQLFGNPVLIAGGLGAAGLMIVISGLSSRTNSAHSSISAISALSIESGAGPVPAVPWFLTIGRDNLDRAVHGVKAL